MKRKANLVDDAAINGHDKKKQQVSADVKVGHQFGPGIFSPETLQLYTSAYADSEPYKHAVVSNLINDGLLRAVRSEIVENIHFTPKETDIYKIHQSGDLANLDGLPASALKKLPSLLQLRDALYSYDFRQWLSGVTGAGALSGKKTDMAVNVYVPGCHLLCHDDVIGSRRVSYILYLTNPDKPWKADWGGGLRLYPTDQVEDDDMKSFKLPQAEWSKTIPPAWNQLSFFAVQPGESFHDVEEVYKRTAGETEDDDGRVRMAISGWFHIPQQGEEGFEPGLEEKLAEKSSLQQLQGKADQFDLPQLKTHDVAPEDSSTEDADSPEMTESDLEYLLTYMTPHYLTPDTVEELNDMFTEECTLQLANFLNPKFAERLRNWLENDKAASWRNESFSTSRPPHKHRYRYMEPQSRTATSETDNPFELVLNDLLPSLAFRKWLALATNLTLKKTSVIARHFRRGLDYQLAQSYEGEDPQLEYCLCVTPSKGWGLDDEGAEGQDDGDMGEAAAVEPVERPSGKGKGKAKVAPPPPAAREEAQDDEDNAGGYELYMAGDDSDDDSDDGSKHGIEVPSSAQRAPQSSTGAGDRRSAKQASKKADPAVYKAAAENEEDDGILVSNPASWNTLSVVLRDRGTLKFVKYVSQSAPGDRWDFAGFAEVEDDDDDDGEEEEMEVEACASK